MSSPESETVKLVYKLANLLDKPPVSIEILPGDVDQWTENDLSQGEQPDRPLMATSPFLFVEGNLGIPQKAMYKLYIAAAVLFKSSKKTFATFGVSEAFNFAPLTASSSILLLANPGHQTALNMRKRLIQNGVLLPEKELCFVAALLVSRGCAKESIIWDHRRWLFRWLYGQVDAFLNSGVSNSPVNGWSRLAYSSHFPKMPSGVILQEFGIVSSACEVYPRNYHAWTHWHFCMETLYFSMHNSENQDRQGYLDVLAGEFHHLRRWVEQHVSDYSAVHHLCSLVHRFHHVDLRSPLSTIPCVIDVASTVNHAISLVTSYPSHETLWMYLRVALHSESSENRRRAISRIESSIFDSQLANRCLAWLAQGIRPHLDDADARSVIPGNLDDSQVQELLRIYT